MSVLTPEIGKVGPIIDVAVKSVCTFATNIANKIGGNFMQKVVAPVISKIPSLGPVISTVINVATVVIPLVVQLLDMKPKEETAEELGLKAEIAKDDFHVVPEDFSTTAEYIEHLREEIHVDKDYIENMNKEQKTSYAMIGDSLYLSAAFEKFGVHLPIEFWQGVTKAKIAAEKIVEMIPMMKDYGITNGAVLTQYFAESSDLAPDLAKQVEQLLHAISSDKEIEAYKADYNATVVAF